MKRIDLRKAYKIQSRKVIFLENKVRFLEEELKKLETGKVKSYKKRGDE